MPTLNQRLTDLNQRIKDAEVLYQRNRDSVKLLAVSKGHSIQEIETVYQLGLRDFAENYLQEALSKVSALNSLPIIWHFIGHIQSNKSWDIVQHFDWVHTLWRDKIAKKLNDAAKTQSKTIKVCIQVNIDEDPNKDGLLVEELEEFSKILSHYDALELRGLMTILKQGTTFEAQCESFAKLRESALQLQQQGYIMDTLSMGMTADLDAAISQGATIVRIGTGIFGPRYDKS